MQVQYRWCVFARRVKIFDTHGELVSGISIRAMDWMVAQRHVTLF